ncbi:tyrosine-protein phosphatase [Amphritea japonica]|uniref:protein-tyrosine-phosphatase n=1 Tax=Amphritea japonica ATCC BAA-1530 TaxID=1278309 RepID=A0A7R6SSD9_9GAMM|nr:CpsB/CapC family capsule biosynthesis tyrosine phosphatase [Amphritea japonica]BBB25472.1 protein-tyrosine phosphatase [Amphritea japonica ATCC BAA-1530]
MIDLHNHILPGIDDGPATLEESLALAEIAVNDGISHIVVTPHIHPGRYDNQISTIQPALSSLQQTLVEKGMPLTLSMGAETRISTEMLTLIPAGLIPYLGSWKGEQVLLLELPHSHILPGTDQLIQWLKRHKITPMIAHPERNKEIMLSPEKLAPFIDAGCLLQLTAMSITGEFGAMAKHCATYILQQEWATVLATDAHNATHRPPILSNGLKAAAEIIGNRAAIELVTSNPATILGRLRD